MRTLIVAPAHIQPSETWVKNLEREREAASSESHQVDVLIVDDSDGKITMPENWRVFDYQKQKEYLGDLYETFAERFHKSSACRNFGHIVAYREKYDVVIGLDSDCVVPFNFVSDHVSRLNIPGGYGWTNPIAGTGMYSRGYPYSQRNWRIVANMGLWENVLDINGKDRRDTEPRRVPNLGSAVAPAPMPFSGMNFAMLVETIPAFLFLPNFKAGVDDFRRIDDVWGGYIYQMLLKKKRQAVIYGQPIVFHDTVVVASEDAAEEAAMYKWEDEFVSCVDNATRFQAPESSYEQLFEMFTRDFKGLNDEGFQELYPSMDWWVNVFKI